jgi:hypothetical protein
MRMMLDSTELLKEVEIFLRGYYETSYYDETKKETVVKKISIGEPKCNEKGVQSLMFWLKMKLTPLITMGNISEDQYLMMLSRGHNNLCRNVMINRINYDIPLNYYLEIIDTMMESYEGVLSSCINGGHRRSFTRNQSVETRETIEKEPRKFLGVF